MSEEVSIVKVAILQDEATNTYFDVYRVKGITVPTLDIQVPREKTGTAEVHRALLNEGADLPLLSDCRNVLEAAIAAPPECVVCRVRRTGWRSDDIYATSHTVIGGDAATLLPPRIANTGRVGVAGDLLGWQAAVAPAIHSTSMIVALSAIFAAPLLQPLNRPGFMLVLYGPSRSGKTTAQLLAASALGYARAEDLPSFNATAAGLLDAAKGFTDMLMPINEMGAARGAKKDVYAFMRSATYAISGGRDTIRHSTWNAGTDQSVDTAFRTIGLLSSEYSPDEWAARAGEERDAGEMARLIGLPAVMEGDEFVFDKPPKSMEGQGFEEWTKQTFDDLHKSIIDHHGCALIVFVEELIADRERFLRVAEGAILEFEGAVSSEAMTPIERDIVSRFAVLWAGARVAIKAGVLPFVPKAVGGMLVKAARMAVDALPDADRDLKSDLAVLAVRLEGRGILHLDTRTTNARLGNADGFRRGLPSGVEYTVRAKVFLRWFKNPIRTLKLLLRIEEEGYLQSAKMRKPDGRSIEWAQNQAAWPDNSRPRSITIRLPRGLDDLNRLR